MRVKLTYTIVGDEEEVIDLKDYGYSSETTWDDLTEDERLEIIEDFEKNCHVSVGGYTDDIDNHEEDYFDNE
jgi:hypothetical protein